ncbi:alpha/beta fold hydrolase [Amycolatopsis acidicola]|uniref:Alpha/beta fold hydrolase n=1 Tax=Amycolatopsis acidicola TaxID=2596893 RepID=A0A5N0UTR3_9PSEU|nr:alpha/beta fold hydrolase [Amycolatopsis acidicola]KAA9155665.1 alpha/beta fold hydrolase [Amycolatopsis acidicola]
MFSELESLDVTTADGQSFVVRLLPHQDPAAPVVLLLPAMAMKAKFYLPMAKALREAGLTAATVDLRAQGESKPALREGPDFGYRELIEVDLPAIVRALQERFPGAPLHLFGHSLGGQVALLYASAHRDQIAGVATIGTGTVFWRAFGPRRWAEALGKIQWIGLVSRVKGWWPGGVLIPGAMAGGVMIDWSRHSLTSRYRPKGTSRNYNVLLRALDLPVLLISLDEDTLGPKSNVDFLGGRIPAAKLAKWHIDADSGVAHRDHFAWIKDSDVIAPAVAAWLVEGKPPA